MSLRSKASQQQLLLPCRELKMAKRYMKATLTGPQANSAKPQVIPSRKVRLMTLRRLRRTWDNTTKKTREEHTHLH